MKFFFLTGLILTAIINLVLVNPLYAGGFDNNQFDGSYFDCSYTVKVLNQTASSGTISVKAPSGCKWKVTNTNNWLTITAGRSGDGNGTVSYVIPDYNGTHPQTGTITIAGKIIQIGQALAPEMTATVPTMTEWGMIVFALLAGLGSAYYLVKRKMPQV